MQDVRDNYQTIQLSMKSLIECVAVELPGNLAAIEAQDIQLYKERFAREGRKYAYSHAWSYIIQACRNFMMRYVSDNLLISLGFHANRFVFVSVLGLNERTLGEFRHLTHLLYEVHPHPIYIKKVFPDQLRYFDSANWTDTQVHPWDNTAHADEDTYPEIITNLQLALDYTSPLEVWRENYLAEIDHAIDPNHLREIGKRRKDFRNELAVFERRNFALSIENYTEDICEEALAFLREYFQHNPDNIEAYHNLLSADLMLENTVQVARVNGKIEGLWILEELQGDCYGLYAAVFSRKHELSGISEALYRLIFEELREKGAKYLALGGCEMEKLYRFKLKFAPQEERQMAMRVYTHNEWWYGN